jgi:hypothetical protein
MPVFLGHKRVNSSASIYFAEDESFGGCTRQSFAEYRYFFEWLFQHDNKQAGRLRPSSSQARSKKKTTQDCQFIVFIFTGIILAREGALYQKGVLVNAHIGGKHARHEEKHSTSSGKIIVLSSRPRTHMEMDKWTQIHKEEASKLCGDSRTASPKGSQKE